MDGYQSTCPEVRNDESERGLTAHAVSNNTAVEGENTDKPRPQRANGQKPQAK